jgi:amino acid adenylation domain-containing protein
MAASDVEGLSGDKRSLLEQRLRGRAAPTPATSGPPRRRTGRGPAPLSLLQEPLWYFSRLAPENPVYNEAVTIRKDGPFEVGAFRAAFNEIVRRHEIWRSTFDVADGEPVQVVHPAPTLELPVVDLSGMSAAERKTEAARMAAEEAKRPYDLARGPLLRPVLVRFAEDHHRLYLAMHHLIFDGVSLYCTILPELVALYDCFSAGCEPSLPEPPIQYADYAAAAREEAMGAEFARRIAYWRQHLDGAPALQLPLDAPRPLKQRFRGAMERVRVSKQLADELRTLSRTSGTTLFQILAAAFAVLLHRYCGQDDIVFGTLTDMRDRREFEGMVGYCLTPLVLRADVREDPSFIELLGRVHDDLLDGLSHEVPFERIVRELHPDRDRGANPIFQAVFVLEPEMVSTDPAWSLHQMEPEVGSAVGHAKFDLHLELDERPEGHLDGRLIYNTDLFAPETATRIASHWAMLLEGIVRAPSDPVSELSLLTEAERHRQLVEWNATSADYPRSACVHELVTAQMQRSPDAVAVVFGDEQLTYRELDRRAKRVAHLLSCSDASSDLVAICVERSLDMLIGMLGILKCGAAYLPLDPHYPAGRLALMLEDSGAAVLLTHRHLLPTLPECRADVVCLDDEPATRMRDDAPAPSVRADRLAYVLYTSGSTGRPKGVCIPHRAVVNLLSSMAERPGMGPADKVVAITTYAFDIAAVELWLPLVTGGCTVIASREEAYDGRRLAGLLARSEPTIMQATPATWQMLIDSGWSGQRGLVALCGGETLTPQLADSLLDRTAAVWNMYGPTETTVWSTVAAVERGSPITIGRPIANTRVYILDRGRQPVPVGVTGEIAIGGDGVGLGYLDRPDLTAERFVPDPFAPGALMYLTGDLGRYLPDGRIEHLGRLDHQIKIRGFRVELGEIEAALAASADVAAAVVVAREQAPWDTRLIAYVVPDGPMPSPSELRHRLAATLPEHMVPSIFVALDALPLSANGKVDRNALPAPRPAPGDGPTSSAAPRTAVEEQMAVIWSRALGVDRVGVHDDFFELGGHSLLAVHLLIEVERELGVEVPLATFLENFTVAGLAATIEAIDGRERGVAGA